MGKQAGFSIIELMITLSILGVLAALAIPSFQSLIADNRRTVLANELVGTLMVARAEAAKRGQTVVVCGTSTASPTACSGSSNWSYGWMAFVDVGTSPTNSTPDGAYEANTDVLLKNYISDYSSTITITSTTGGSPAANVPAITLAAFNQQSTVASIKLCDKRGAAYARAANVSASGRAEVSPGNGGQYLDVTGAAITCP